MALNDDFMLDTDDDEHGDLETLNTDASLT